MVAADALTAWKKGEDTPEAEVGALLVAGFFSDIRGIVKWLRG